MSDEYAPDPSDCWSCGGSGLTTCICSVCGGTGDAPKTADLNSAKQGVDMATITRPPTEEEQGYLDRAERSPDPDSANREGE
jgi:hypothetical protein